MTLSCCYDNWLIILVVQRFFWYIIISGFWLIVGLTNNQTMNLKTYLTIMILATSVCWATWAVVINSIDPNTTNVVGFSLFYASLFLSIVGTTALVGFVLRFVLLRKDLVFRQVVIAFRQSFLFATIIIGSLILQSFRMLTWYNAILLIAALTVLEFFLISYKRA